MSNKIFYIKFKDLLILKLKVIKFKDNIICYLFIYFDYNFFFYLAIIISNY